MRENTYIEEGDNKGRSRRSKVCKFYMYTMAKAEARNKYKIYRIALFNTYCNIVCDKLKHNSHFIPLDFLTKEKILKSFNLPHISMVENHYHQQFVDSRHRLWLLLN